MKRRIAWFISGLSGLYLLTIGIMPDPLPFVDEAIVLTIFLKSMSYLGYDMTRWIPFIGKGRKKRTTETKGQTIDV